MATPRRLATVSALLVATLGLAACSSASGGSSSSTNAGSSAAGSGSAGAQGKATLWVVAGPETEKKTYQAAVDAYNKLGKGTIDLQAFQNDPYKQKLQTAMGAGQPADIFFNFGGGSLKAYVDAGKVADITGVASSDPAFQKFLPSVMKTVTYDGKVRGVPLSGIQPVMMFMNKDVFAKYNVQPPTTWDELLAAVKTFKSNGVIPIALGGASKWPELMYEEYLVDRLGGPDVFKNIAANKPGAWSDPAVTAANQKIQELVNAGAFGSSYASTAFDGGQTSALLYTGKAAMHLMGNWEFDGDLAANPAFIQQGKLGYFPFPSVPGGTGDAKNIVGNPATFLSASANGNTAVAQEFFKQLASDEYVDSLIKIGNIPAVAGAETKLKSAEHADWLLFNFDLAKNAPSFTQSWDQALAPAVGAALLDNLSKLFLGQLTPEQFATNMNATIK
jgi:raffinose/stachyose/melibiose transport system substrate-binding protein